MKHALSLVLVLTAACVTNESATEQDLDTTDGNGQPDNAMLGLHYARGEAQSSAATPGTPLLWHNGAVMNNAAVQAIYWGTSWASTTYQSDKISGLDTFYGGLNNTSYMASNTEYTGSGNTKFTGGISYGGHVIDTSTGPRHAPKTSAIANEVCKMISNPVANGYYPVYTDLPRGHAGYCAWHSYGTCNGVPVQFGFFFDLNGDPGCDPQSTLAGSQGLTALANVSGHEISETVTDPRSGGWYDSSGAENADKCAWTWGNPVTIGGRTWKIQGNFSNAANSTGTGYDGAGCIE